MGADPALLPTAAGALAGLLGAAAAREAVLASPAAVRWLAAGVEPLVRAGTDGHEPTSGERRRLAVLGTVLLLLCGWLVAGPAAAPALAVAGPAAAGWAVARRRARYRRAVERRLPALATALADALAGGRSVRGALAQAVASLEGPAAAEMARVSADLDLGASTAEALEALRRRMRSQRVDSLVAALLSQRLAGGDLALLLRRYAEAAAERDRMAEDARAATAQARFTGMLVVAMPTGGALFAELVHPGFVAAILANGAAAALLLAAGGLQLAGFAAIRRMSAVDR